MKLKGLFAKRIQELLGIIGLSSFGTRGKLRSTEKGKYLMFRKVCDKCSAEITGKYIEVNEPIGDAAWDVEEYHYCSSECFRESIGDFNDNITVYIPRDMIQTLFL